MSFITTLLGAKLERVLDETETPTTTHADMLFEKRIRGVLGGMMVSQGDYVPRCKAKLQGRNVLVRPTDVTTFLYFCNRAGISDHPAARELNRRFATDPDFYLEFRHDG